MYFIKKKELLKFITDNKDKYKEKVPFFEEFISMDYLINIKNIVPPTEVAELLSKFNIYKTKYDPYLEMSYLLEKYSFLEDNCCEIGAGYYPRLAEIVLPKIKLNRGSLTIYEPEIMFSNIENMKVVKEKFTKDTDIEKFDTLYGLYPCEATIAIAEKAFEEDKNLMIAFCSCDNSTKEHPKWIGKYWAEDFCMDYREKYGEEVEIINGFPHNNSDLPIMVRRSRKYKKVK